MDEIAVLIPCYNEAATVAKVVADYRAALPGATIYVYDNNSTDGTGALAAAAGAVVRREAQQGKGNVLRRMFREVDARCYLLVDGDDTYPADAAPKMVAAVLEHGADMVVGDRLSSTYFTENKRPFHNFGNSLVRFSINRLFGSRIQDIMTGYRAFSFLFAKTFPVLSRGFEIETEMSIHAVERNMQIGAKVLGTILRLYKNYRPFGFFSLLAAMLAVLSAGFMVPVVAEYFRTGLVPRFPTLIVCACGMVAALLLFTAGIVLSNLLTQDARNFEFKLQQAERWRREAERRG